MSNESVVQEWNELYPPGTKVLLTNDDDEGSSGKREVCMATIKCIGCYDLLREEMNMTKGVLIVYICRRFFPYSCALSGLLRPASGTLKAAEMCPEKPLDHCILCPSTEVIHYGENIASTCEDHYQAWSKWLDEHPERRAYLHSPHGRAKKANWIEVFREFIEDMRLTQKGGAPCQ